MTTTNARHIHLNSPTRRTFLKSVSATAGGLLLAVPDSWARETTPRVKLPVAGVATWYHPGSHAHVILGKILEGWNQDGGPGPDLELVSLYIDQFSQDDMNRELAKKFGFRLAKSIDEAVNLGGDKVGVAGVLSIGEHGNYPHDPVTKQVLYPRKRFFDEIVAAMNRGGQFVPIFNDKHLSARTEEAMAMYRTAKELNIPFMAGSSLPVAWRVPPLELPMGCHLEAAMAIGYGGLEGYGFHALETLQCMVERRRGGEVGVEAVRAARGEAILEAEKEGYWSKELLAAALRTNRPELSDDWLAQFLKQGRPFYLIDYRDGFKSSVAMANYDRFLFACKLKDEQAPLATTFTLQGGIPHRHFAWLLRGIEHMVHTGQPAYPAERTLITTGILDAAMRSLAQGDTRIETPQLEIAYTSTDWGYAPGQPPPPREEY